MMGNNSILTHSISFQNVFIGNHIWKSKINKSKYLDLETDTQTGFHLGDVEEMKKEYLEEYCNGVPWETVED